MLRIKSSVFPIKREYMLKIRSGVVASLLYIIPQNTIVDTFERLLLTCQGDAARSCLSWLLTLLSGAVWQEQPGRLSFASYVSCLSLPVAGCCRQACMIMADSKMIKPQITSLLKPFLVLCDAIQGLNSSKV